MINLLVISDDETIMGSYITSHSNISATTPLQILKIIHRDGASNQATTTRVGISFSDQVRLNSLNDTSFIVKPVDGEPINGWWGVTNTVVNFYPEQPLLLNTEYEIILPQNGVSDLIGNTLEDDFISYFYTEEIVINNTLSELFIDTTPVSVKLGEVAFFSIEDRVVDGRKYIWDFGDGTSYDGLSSATVVHTYSTIRIIKGTEYGF